MVIGKSERRKASQDNVLRFGESGKIRGGGGRGVGKRPRPKQFSLQRACRFVRRQKRKEWPRYEYCLGL